MHSTKGFLSFTGCKSDEWKKSRRHKDAFMNTQNTASSRNPRVLYDIMLLAIHRAPPFSKQIERLFQLWVLHCLLPFRHFNSHPLCSRGAMQVSSSNYRKDPHLRPPDTQSYQQKNTAGQQRDNHFIMRQSQIELSAQKAWCAICLGWSVRMIMGNCSHFFLRCDKSCVIC